MADKCDIIKNLKTIEKEVDEQVAKDLDDAANKTAPSDSAEEAIVDAIEEELINQGVEQGDIVKYSTLKQIYKKVHGKGTEKEFIAIIIKSMVRQNPAARMIADDYLMKTLKTYDNIKDLTLDRLKNLFYYISTFNQADDTHGILGKRNFIINLGKKFKKSLYTPKGLGKLEYTGALFNFSQTMDRYMDNIQNRVNLFAKGRKIGIKTREGMASVIEDVLNLESFLGKDSTHYHLGYVHNDVKLVELFSQIMMGWVKYENGKLLIAKDYLVVRDMFGNKAFWPDGTVKKEFENFIPLQDAFTSETHPDGAYNIDFGKNTEAVLDKLFGKDRKSGPNSIIGRARKVDDAAYKYIQLEFNKSVDALLLSMAKLFPGKNIQALFYTPEGSKMRENAINELSDKELALYNMINKSISELSSVTFFQYATDLSTYKKNHWPRKFGTWKFSGMWDNHITEMAEELDATINGNLNNRLRNRRSMLGLKQYNQLKKDGKEVNFEFYYRGVSYTGTTAKFFLDRRIAELKKSIKRAKDIRDDHDGYSFDTKSNVPIVKAKDQQVLKRITQAFNPMHSRLTKGVYGDHLYEAMSNIERNHLTATLIDSIAMLQRKDGSFNQEALEWMLNYYGVPFNRPETYGTLGPMKYSVENLSTKLGKVWINFAPEEIQHMARWTGSYITFRYLKGYKTAIQNITAVNQHMNIGSMRLFHEALKVYMPGGLERKAYLDLIGRSGVIDFSDFFSESMVNDISGVELDNKTTQTILGAMLLYYSRNKKNPGKEAEHEKEMNEHIGEALAQSRTFMEYTVQMLSEKRAKKRLKKIKQDRLRQVTAKLANYAITKRFEVSRHLKDVPMFKNTIGKVINIPRAKVFGALQKFYGSFMMFFTAQGKITMGGGEEMIRSIAFIMGVQHAQRKGVLPFPKPISELTREEELVAIEYGKYFSKLFNYGLSTTDIGEIGWGAIGNHVVKFTYWSMQKFGGDVQINNEGARVDKSLENLAGELGLTGKAADDSKAFLKKWKKVLTTSFSELRRTDPSIAAYRGFITSGLFFVTLVDVLLIGPLIYIPRVMKLLNFYPFAKKSVRGLSSDYLSLKMAPLVIALYALKGGYDDEEDIERHSQHYLRRTFLGFLPNYVIDIWWGLYMAAVGNEDSFYRHVKNWGGTFVPFEPVRISVDEIIDALTKD